ncbi:AAA family ATPase [Undibacterium sp. RTI2.1]|uniref:nucleotide-binding protein n=1 Tax=unclassified Undibacterium TaxID=2630295 RepID=UPI002AB3D651|nr:MULTISPECIES: AAA family ATPase [unclassified Undibacterium]MDY7540776.1 AAA family ATPase [Undibacterium sp. 5I1]MEB0032291.1 AAA family ATPase [Undibacterium sp. RTI2.1]MEB0118434.1 AAA family ATPase [Undibacterium sp. RTI2.2]MEB0233048.1 AAA family ATPase [Undibacterium sp. 10I3]MEB0259420.1 AAA family ATPase [Undibacterium sp. 5I1]
MIVVVGAEKGGVGKTLLATNIAACAVSDGFDVCLMDTDPQGSSSAWGRIRRADPSLKQFPIIAIPENPTNEITSMADKYDLIVIDIGAQNYLTMLNTAAIADLILVPCGSDQYEGESTMRVMEMLKAMDYKHKKKKVPAFIVLNRLSTNSKSKEPEATRAFFEEDGYPVFESELKDRSSWKNSRRAGMAMHEMTGKYGDKKATLEIKNLYSEIKRFGESL